MAADVNDHGQLEEEHPSGIKGAQRGQEGHGGAPVGQHIKHGTKLGTLVQDPGGVAIKCVQKS